MTTVTDKDLRNELRDMQDRFRSLKDDELFVAWFMKCFVTDTEDAAVASLVGGPGDKSLDAIHIDDASRSVFIVQGKYRQKPNGPERRGDLLAFADLARAFCDEGAFRIYRRDLSDAAAGKAAEAHKRIATRGYRLQLYFVTSGHCSEALAREVEGVVRRAAAGGDIDVIDGKRVLRLLSDYLDGVAPPVPLLEVELESGRGIKLDGVLQRFDSQTNIESWVVPVTVDQVAQMYEKAGIRLFARNVRGFLGSTEVNRNMRETLRKEPEYFWYYNNGITIVCDSAEELGTKGSKKLRLVNPQIINGQQTTRTLHDWAGRNSKATVLVRVISVPRETEQEAARFENLVSQIVAATNYQNAIRASDLMANDRRQIELERALRKLDYQYLRKRQSKGEARRNAGLKHRFVITKEELAQVVAACDLDPLVVRTGKEQLFEKTYYGTVFPTSDPDYYLPQYWLGKHVTSQAKGYPERSYAKWLALHFCWQRLAREVPRKTARQLFRMESERGLWANLCTAVDAVFQGCSAYYRQNRGAGATQVDPSGFFKRANHHVEFERFWRSSANRRHSALFSRAWAAFSRELDAVVNQ